MDEQISLADYAAQALRFDLRGSQIRLCAKLETAYNHSGVRAAIWVEPQAGVSVILERVFPAWVLGVEPLHRFVVGSYSEDHSRVISRDILFEVSSELHSRVFGGHGKPVGSFRQWHVPRATNQDAG